MIFSPPLAEVGPAASSWEAPRATAGEWAIELARPEDDAALRLLVASNPVPGRITLGFEREPSYFAGCRTLGPLTQVAVARHRHSGAIGAVACRSVRSRFVNGNEQPVGYLSQLRVDHAYRGQWLAAAVLRALPLLHADGRTPGYLAAITDDNAEAHGVLVRRARRGLPDFQRVTRLCTLALYVRHTRRPLSMPWWRHGGAGGGASRLELVPGDAVGMRDVVSFVRREGRRRQFFPSVTEADFGPGGSAPNLALSDVVVARRGGQLVGAGALWDQSALKQTVVHEYGGALRRLRTAYNLGARLVGAAAPPLPAPGAHIRSAYASFLAVANDDAVTCDALLGELLSLAAARGRAYVLAGFAEEDPLLAVARRRPHVAYGSTLYTVCPPGSPEFHAVSDGRLPQVEIATL